MERAFYFIVLIFIITVSCNSSKKARNNDAYKISKREMRALLQDTTLPRYILVSSGSIQPVTKIYLNNIKFDLVVKGTDTTYLTTNDINFITPEGFSVGVKFSELPDSLRVKLIQERGWGYFVKLPSKWTLGFCEGSSCTDSYPKPNSKVKWIFKRKF